MNTNNIVDLLSQTKNYEAHRKKINQIMNKGSGVSFDNRRIKVINSFYSNKDKALRYSQRAKQQAVQKQNDLILKKIIDVNNRRNNNLQNAQVTRTSSHNSLQNMKKQINSINQQNQRLAHKLVSTTSDLRQNKFSSSYKMHLERKQRLKKYEFDQEVGMIIPKKIKSLQKFMTLEPLNGQGTSRYTGYSRVSGLENQQY